MLGPPCSRLARFIDGHHGTVMVAMLRVCHEAHHLHYGAQGMTLFLLKWVYLGVAEAIVGSLLCCGGGILFSVFLIIYIMSFGDYTHPQHQATTFKIITHFQGS